MRDRDGKARREASDADLKKTVPPDYPGARRPACDTSLAAFASESVAWEESPLSELSTPAFCILAKRRGFCIGALAKWRPVSVPPRNLHASPPARCRLVSHLNRSTCSTVLTRRCLPTRYSFVDSDGVLQRDKYAVSEFLLKKE